jgi:uncharacterized protein YraI
MSFKSVGTLAVIGFLSLPGIAMAGSLAVATTNVNVRAGPDIGYPVVDVARAGDEVYVYGCLERRSWCDVDYDGLRGWISSNYLAFYDGGYRYVGPQAVYRMRAPVITFSFGTYWDRHYRSRSFYRDRSRWEHFYHGRPRAERPRTERVPPRSSRRWERRDDHIITEDRGSWRRGDEPRRIERTERRRGERSERRRSSSRDEAVEELLRHGQRSRGGSRWAVEQ